MMTKVSEDLLTGMLVESGQLSNGSVEVSVQTPSSYVATMSKLYDLQLTYSAGSSGQRPDKCLMKVTEPAMFRAGRAESNFYHFMKQDPGAKPDALVEVYGTLVDDQAQQAVLLMKDMSGPFVQADWPVPFQQKDCLRVAAALAGIHAHWWGGAQAKAEKTQRASGRTEAVERIRSCARNLLDRLGDALSPDRRALIELLVQVYPDLHESRLVESGRATIVHGDAHLWNFLIPVDAAQRPMLIDWQLWGVDFAAADLAYMMALHWFPERRQRFEKPMVAAHTAALQRLGIDCDFKEAWDDYRFMVAGLLTKVVIYASVIPAGIWWPHLERAFLAYEDLDCAELISR